jgi:acetolactate synthase-1/3 small subunit
MNKEFTLSVFTENRSGLLHRVTTMFTRRNLNIESLTVSDSEREGMHRFTIVINTTEDQARKITLQIDKQIEVSKAFYHVQDEIVYQEIALYKVPTSVLAESREVEQLVRDHQARILTVDPEFVVIEKTGHHQETQDLLTKLKLYGVLEFVRSGRVAVTKPMKQLEEHLTENQLAFSA